MKGPAAKKKSLHKNSKNIELKISAYNCRSIRSAEKQNMLQMLIEADQFQGVGQEVYLLSETKINADHPWDLKGKPEWSFFTTSYCEDKK